MATYESTLAFHRVWSAVQFLFCTAARSQTWRAATHTATFCSRGPPACSGLPSRAERERAEPSPPGRRGGRGGVPVPARRVRLCRPWPMQAPT